MSRAKPIESIVPWFMAFEVFKFEFLRGFEIDLSFFEGLFRTFRARVAYRLLNDFVLNDFLAVLGVLK